MRSRGWKVVAAGMAAGAVYDAAFGLGVLAALGTSARLLGLEVPDDPVYVRLVGILLLLVAGLYALPAVDPSRYRGVVAVAAAGRLGGFLFLMAAWSAGRPAAFLGLALGDLAFSVIHAVTLRRAIRYDTP